MNKLARSLFSKILHLALFSMAGILTSCSSQTPIKKGHALIEIDREGNTQARIRNPRFVRNNGRAINPAKTHLDLAPGPQELEIRFAFPGKVDREAKLKFKARANLHYLVTFDPYPPVGGGRVDLEDGIWTRSEFDGFLFIPNVVGMAGVNAMKTIDDRSKAIQWAYIRVVSSDVAEGIVEQVRVP